MSYSQSGDKRCVWAVRTKSDPVLAPCCRSAPNSAASGRIGQVEPAKAARKSNEGDAPEAEGGCGEEGRGGLGAWLNLRSEKRLFRPALTPEPGIGSNIKRCMTDSNAALIKFQRSSHFRRIESSRC
jgi:hypothetical protein